MSAHITVELDVRDVAIIVNTLRDAYLDAGFKTRSVVEAIIDQLENAQVES